MEAGRDCPPFLPSEPGFSGFTGLTGFRYFYCFPCIYSLVFTGYFDYQEFPSIKLFHNTDFPGSKKQYQFPAAISLPKHHKTKKIQPPELTETLIKTGKQKNSNSKIILIIKIT